ncbi:MAG: DUF2934 domain-containing protein [Gammaproteobacteria bacterium]
MTENSIMIRLFPHNINNHAIRMMISEAAYFKAKSRGFAPGHEEEDWLEAEKEINSCVIGYFDYLYYH